MKNLKIFFVLIFTSILLTSFTSFDGNGKKATSNRKKNKIAVKNAVKQLKDGGAVIYIVKDRKVKTDMLKEKGMEARALELEKNRLKKEKIIVKGLVENFKFCPIYFILQSDMDKVQAGNLTGHLLDTTLSKNDAIVFNHTYFLMLDYGDVYDEQSKVYCDSCKSDLTGAMSLKHDAFVFKNKFLSQLTKPFPFYITCHYPAKEIAIKIEKLNKRLQAFYNKASE